MFGQGCPLVEPDFGVDDFCGGVGLVVDVDVDVVGVLVEAVEVVEALGSAVLCVDGDAAAPAMPATAPPVASAPATIVAPSSLEMVIGVEPPGLIAGEQQSCATALSASPRVCRGSVRRRRGRLER
jgi:hypothetical protein